MGLVSLFNLCLNPQAWGLKYWGHERPGLSNECSAWGRHFGSKPVTGTLPLCMLGKFICFMSSVEFFEINFFENYFRNTISVKQF